MPPKVSCDGCGGTEFSLHDGHYYCKICSTMSQRLMEFDNDVMVNVRARVKDHNVRPPKKKKEKKKHAKFFEDGFDIEAIKHWTSHTSNDYPIYIRQTGRRVTTFARIVALWTETMITDFDVPETIRDVSISLVQKYFAFHGIAFCEGAVASESEKAKYRWRIKKPELKAMKIAAEEKKEKSLAEKKAQLEKSQKEDFLSFMNQTAEEAIATEETLRLEIANEEMNEPVIGTEKSEEANFNLKNANLAGKIYLEIDMVIAVIFSACQIVGATWITLSDITRWYREDRLEVTAAQLNGLGMAPDKDETKLDEFYKRCFKTPSGSMTLSESFHSVILISHACLPPKLPTLEFKTIVDRLVWHLNLPTVFQHRLKVILEAIIDPVCDVGKDYISELCPLVSDPTENIDEIKKSFGYISYFRKIFLTETLNQETFLTSEVKAMSIIVFGLKLVFGLDGRRETNMKTDESLPSSMNFNFSEWMIQLRLRISVWKDYEMNYEQNNDVDEVLETVTNDLQNDLNEEERKIWLHLFPCSEKYVLYPRPESFACLFGIKDIVYPMNRCKSSKLLYDDMKRYLPPDFVQLIELLSLVIGEDPHVLFITFLMVEMMYFRKKKLQQLEEGLRNGKKVKTNLSFDSEIIDLYKENVTTVISLIPEFRTKDKKIFKYNHMSAHFPKSVLFFLNSDERDSGTSEMKQNDRRSTTPSGLRRRRIQNFENLSDDEIFDEVEEFNSTEIFSEKKSLKKNRKVENRFLRTHADLGISILIWRYW